MDSSVCSDMTREALGDLYGFNQYKNQLFANQFEYDAVHLLGVVERYQQKWKHADQLANDLDDKCRQHEDAAFAKDERIRKLEAELKDARAQLAAQLSESNALKLDLKDLEAKFKLVQGIVRKQLPELSSTDRQQLAFLNDDRQIQRTHSKRLKKNPLTDHSSEDSLNGGRSEGSLDYTRGSDDDEDVIEHMQTTRTTTRVYRRSGALAGSDVERRRSRSAYTRPGKRSHSKSTAALEERPEGELPKKRSFLQAAHPPPVAARATTSVKHRVSLNRSYSADDLLRDVPNFKKVLTPTMASSSTDIRRAVGPAWTGGRPIAERPHTFVPFSAYVRVKSCDVCNGAIHFGGRASFKCQDCHQLCHSSCKARLPIPCVPRTPKTPTRNKGQGIVLTDYCPATSPMIPYPIIHCVVALERRGCLSHEGLYRIPALQGLSKRLLNELISTRAIPKMDMHDPEVIADTIKGFLRNLNDSLIPRTSIAEFVDAVQKKDDDLLNKYIKGLPQPHRDTLAYLCLHWQRVGACSEVNKMPVENIARCVAPSIMKYMPSGAELIGAQETVRLHVEVVTVLLKKPQKEWQDLLSQSTAPRNFCGTMDSRIEMARLTETPPMDKSILGPVSTPIAPPSTTRFRPRTRLFDSPC
ncbi:unnamed protein product, partial [Mesorhabditis spiculigera]